MRTLTANNQIDRLFAGGRRASHPALLVLALRTPEGEHGGGRVVYVAGKRLGGAVQRNRCKRVMREMVRRADADLTGWDIAVVAKRSTASAGSATLDAAFIEALRRLGVSP